MTDLLEFSDVETKTPDGPVISMVVSRHMLDKALAAVASVVPSKDLIPVLKNVHVRVSGTDVRLSASDTILSAVAHFDALHVKTEGAAVFPASRLLSLVREAEGDTLAIGVKSQKEKMSAVVKSDKASWSFPLMPPNGFPDFSEHEQIGTVPVNREGFLRALAQVRKAVSTDTMRPYFMLVDVSKGRLRASDSNRFQEVKFEFPFDCQIPSRALPELVNRMTNCADEEIQVGQMNSCLLFRIGKALFVSQKVAAKFPDVDEVLLKPAFLNDQEFHVDREALLHAVRRARITADEETSAVVLSLNKGSVSVECKDRKGGVAVEEVEAEWDYAPRHLSFNHQHLTDLLSSTKSVKCVFRLGKDLKTKPTPLLMEDKEAGFTAVLSQIRTDWL